MVEALHIDPAKEVLELIPRAQDGERMDHEQEAEPLAEKGPLSLVYPSTAPAEELLDVCGFREQVRLASQLRACTAARVE